MGDTLEMKNPFDIVEAFEKRMAEYTGAPYAVAVDSCTNALFLCLKYIAGAPFRVVIPKKTYVSVPMTIIHAGGKVGFEDREWEGVYQLKPFVIWDAAKRLTSGMYIPGEYMCLSFHIKKHIPIGKGGMILTENKMAVEWFKKARYEGRSAMPYHEDDIKMLGWNMYMTPEQAARGLTLMQNYPQQMPDLTEDYKDLTEFSIFKPENQ